MTEGQKERLQNMQTSGASELLFTATDPLLLEVLAVRTAKVLACSC